jgi:molybdate transport system ATP-binding protein
VYRLDFQCIHRFPGGFTVDARLVASAQVTALFGPSGSGKTSILYMIAGLLRPQSGSIALRDHVWLDTKRGIFLKPEQRRVGFVFQDHLLFPHLSVERNLMYGRSRRVENRAIDPARVIQVLELGELLSRYPRNLSGGEKQRVAMGRALLSNPNLLLLDEPMAGLDDALKNRVLTYFERILTEWSIPTLYVSHDVADVRRLAERVVVLESGRVTASGSPEEIWSANYLRSGDSPD